MSLENKNEGESLPTGILPPVLQGTESEHSMDEMFNNLDAPPDGEGAAQPAQPTTGNQPTNEGGEQPAGQEAGGEQKEGGEQPAEGAESEAAEITDDTKIKVKGPDGQEMEVTGKQLQEALQQSTFAESVPGALVKPDVILNDANTLSQQHGINVIEEEAKALVANIDKTFENYQTAQQALMAADAEITQAQSEGDNAALAVAQQKYRAAERDMNAAAMEQTRLKGDAPNIQNRLNEAMGRTSVALMQKHFPQVVKAGETINSVAARVHERFGLPYDKALAALRDPMIASFACYAIIGHSNLANGVKALSQAKEQPNKALVLSMGGQGGGNKGGAPAATNREQQALAAAIKQGEAGNLQGLLDAMDSMEDAHKERLAS